MTTTSRPTPLETATRLHAERFPSARVLFCGGSVVRGDGREHSDLELERAFAHFFRTGNRAAVLSAIDRVLEPFGGRCFEGLRSDAPATSRLASARIPGLDEARGKVR